MLIKHTLALNVPWYDCIIFFIILIKYVCVYQSGWDYRYLILNEDECDNIFWPNKLHLLWFYSSYELC